MLIKLGHEALAETHNFIVGLALGVEIGTALTAADGQTGQRVFENLLETEELKNSEVYRRMETDAALVGSDCAVELNAVTLVYMNLAVVVNPRNAEHNGTLGLDKSFEQGALLIFGMSLHNGGQRFENLGSCLVKLLFTGVFCLEFFENSFGI